MAPKEALTLFKAARGQLWVSEHRHTLPGTIYCSKGPKMYSEDLCAVLRGLPAVLCDPNVLLRGGMLRLLKPRHCTHSSRTEPQHCPYFFFFYLQAAPTARALLCAFPDIPPVPLFLFV